MLIGLTGPKQAGKDTVYERARHIMADVVPVERVSFADALYESAAASLGVPVAALREWKNSPNVTVQVKSGPFLLRRATIREYLQRYGTEAHRDIWGPNFWVDGVNLEHAGRFVFVTDVRFESEALAVKRAGGIVLRVFGPFDVEDAGDGHASEAGLPPELLDGFIQNVVRDDGYRCLDFALNGILQQMLQGKRP